MNIGFIGAGSVAKKLGKLLKKADYSICYGTRNQNGNEITISEAIATSDVVFLAIPYKAVNEVVVEHKNLFEGKIVVDVTNPINPQNWKPLNLDGDSAGENLVRLLPNAHVVKAFNSIFAEVMDEDKQGFGNELLTAFIASNDKESANVIKKIADDIGFDGYIVGDITNSRYLEALANLNIALALAGGGTDAGFVYRQRR